MMKCEFVKFVSSSALSSSLPCDLNQNTKAKNVCQMGMNVYLLL